MRLVRDSTGRFPQRPHFRERELDQECEKILTDFFIPLYGHVPTPITTDDLTRLIERDTGDFDPGADLSAYGSDVEGVTEFRRGKLPVVRIAADLAYDDRRENRYRTTLTHEYGHVQFHDHLFQVDEVNGDLLNAERNGDVQICKRDTLVDAPQRDWMEWQAGYVCGALLMPAKALRNVVAVFQESAGLFGPISVQSANGYDLIQRVRKTFRVSADAARVRLMRMKLLSIGPEMPSLFDSVLNTQMR